VNWAYDEFVVPVYYIYCCGFFQAQGFPHFVNFVHNGRLGVICFKVFECGGWVEDRVLVADLGRRFALLGASGGCSFQ